MLKTVGENTQGQRFDSCDRLTAVRAIRQGTRNLRNLSNPASIGFLLSLDG